MKRTLLAGLLSVGVLSAPGLLRAGTNGFVVPFFRGSAASEAGHWESFTAPVVVNSAAPVIERGLYPHNATPCDRPGGSAFATFDDRAGAP